MKPSARIAAAAAGLLAVFASPSGAQTTKRPITGSGSFGGGLSSGGITVSPGKPTTTTTTVTYLALTKDRQWLSADGRSIMARLVAFDAGDDAKFIAPTVIKDNKVRLLKDKKAFVYPLDKLDLKHQDDVREIDDKLKAVYEAKKDAAAGGAK